MCRWMSHFHLHHHHPGELRGLLALLAPGGPGLQSITYMRVAAMQGRCRCRHRGASRHGIKGEGKVGVRTRAARCRIRGEGGGGDKKHLSMEAKRVVEGTKHAWRV